MYLTHDLMAEALVKSGFPFTVAVNIRPVLKRYDIRSWLFDHSLVPDIADLKFHHMAHFKSVHGEVATKTGHDHITVFGFADHRLATSFKLLFG